MLPPAPHVHVFSCQVVAGIAHVPEPDEIGLVVRFQNDSKDALESIVWRAKYGRHFVDFIDNGSFAPAVRVDSFPLFQHGTTRFDWLIQRWVTTPTRIEYVSSEDPENCTVVRARWAGGDTWLNPALAQKPEILPTPAPTPRPRPRPTPTPTPPPTTVPPYVDLFHCTLSVINGWPKLAIEFQSHSRLPADRMVFRARYGSGELDFTDSGTFTPDAPIAHWLKMPPPEALKQREYVSFDDVDDCDVMSVHYTDGSSWTSPAFEPAAPVPTPVPNAFYMNYVIRWGDRHDYPTPPPSPPP